MASDRNVSDLSVCKWLRAPVPAIASIGGILTHQTPRCCWARLAGAQGYDYLRHLLPGAAKCGLVAWLSEPPQGLEVLVSLAPHAAQLAIPAVRYSNPGGSIQSKHIVSLLLPWWRKAAHHTLGG